MNKRRRKKLCAALEYLGLASSSLTYGIDYQNIKYYLDHAMGIVSAALDEEQDCLDNTPENLQDTDRYYLMEQSAESLEDAVSYIEDVLYSLDDADRHPSNFSSDIGESINKVREAIA